jgi:methylmalonyl-CoA mutase N-terminal domain/subunit
MRAARDSDAYRRAVGEVALAAREGTNLMPPIVAAVEAHDTLGEISDALRSVFGSFEETATL